MEFLARAFELKVTAARRGAKDTGGLEIGHDLAERTTFVVKRDGTIAAAVGGVSPEANVKRSLAPVQRLSAGH